MNIIRTLGFAAVAAMSLGGVAMAQNDGYSTPDPYARTQQPAATYRAPVATQPQSGSSDVNTMQFNRMSPTQDYGDIDSPG